MDLQKTEILIVGGGLGGCAAALAALEAGCRVIITETTDWVGGQLTAQGVPPDEHGWIEQFGRTRSYARLRDGIRQFYRDHYPLTEKALKQPLLNPGNGWVSQLCHEPKVSVAVLQAMLAPYIRAKRLIVMLNTESEAVTMAQKDQIEAVQVRNLKTGISASISAKYVIDATELGDLLPLSGTEYVTGFESHEQTGEPSAPQKAEPNNVQAFSICFAMEYREGEDHTINRPSRYPFWRQYIPALSPPWPGPLLSWTVTHPRTMDPHSYGFDPNREPNQAFSGLWSYRRILDRHNFESGHFSSDICLVNWPMIDYLEGNLCSATDEERRQFIEEAKQLSICLLYWLQTDAPRPDGGQGWSGLRLRHDVMDTSDGLAKYPYIRESRRIQAMFTVCEQHVSQACRPDSILAEQFEDSVGIGYYRIDLHPSTGGDNYLDLASLPFQIPLATFIPIRMKNLIPGCKNIGTTHITNGCYRLHPVEWNIGEVAGALCAFCLDRKRLPKEVSTSPKLRKDFQSHLIKRGIELKWPANLSLQDGDPHRHANANKG